MHPFVGIHPLPNQAISIKQFQSSKSSQVVDVHVPLLVAASGSYVEVARHLAVAGGARMGGWVGGARVEGRLSVVPACTAIVYCHCGLPACTASAVQPTALRCPHAGNLAATQTLPTALSTTSLQVPPHHAH